MAQPLAGVAYPWRSYDLARYQADPNDDLVLQELETGLRQRSTWDVLQSSLDEEACYALLAFAQRRAAAALRTRQSSFALSAVQALALMTRAKMEYRDISVDFPLYAVRESGGDLPGAIEFALSYSEPGMRDAFKARAGCAKRVSLADCGYVVVTSRHGLGFMPTMGQPAPVRADLPVAALAVADRIDDSGEFEVNNLHLSDLPWIWFDRTKRGDDLPTQGCVSIWADRRGTPRFSHRLLVFIADVADDATARALADMARGALQQPDPQTARSGGSRVLIVIGDWNTAPDGRVEAQASLSQLADSLGDAAFEPGLM